MDTNNMTTQNEHVELPRIIRMESVDSTNNYLRELIAKEDLPDGSAVLVDFQTAGRGQTGNSWESERGKNLTFSIAVYPSAIPANRQFLISQISALSIKDALDSHTGGIYIKWPNDIYWEDRKISGMLIENNLMGTSIHSSVIGIGLNLNQKVFKSNAPNPVSLCQITGKEYDREEVFSHVLSCFYKRYLQLLHGEFGKIAKDYAYSLYRREGFFTYRDGKGVFKAQIKEIEPDGHLVLQLPGGEIRKYAFKEVEFVIQAQD